MIDDHVHEALRARAESAEGEIISKRETIVALQTAVGIASNRADKAIQERDEARQLLGSYSNRVEAAERERDNMRKELDELDRRLREEVAARTAAEQRARDAEQRGRGTEV